MTLVIALAGLFLGGLSTCQNCRQDRAESRATVATLLDDAWTQLEDGDLRGARLQVRLAEIRAPQDPRVFVFRGLIDENRHRWSSAEDNYSNALAENPRSVAAHLHLGLLMIEHGPQEAEDSRLEEAHFHLLEAERLSDNTEEEVEADRVSVLTKLGWFLLKFQPPTDPEARARQWTEASEFLAKALSLDPSDPDATALMAEYLAQQGKFHDAEQKYCQAIRRRPASPELWVGLASILYLEDDLEGAERALRRAITLRPRDPETHKFLGLVLFDEGHFDEASAIEQEAQHPYGFL